MIQVKLSDGHLELRYKSYNASSKKFFFHGGVLTVYSKSDDVLEALKETLNIFNMNNPKPYSIKPKAFDFY